MRLDKWLKKEGYGALSRLSRDTGIAQQTLRNVRDEIAWTSGRCCSLETARAVEEATGGEVSEAEAMYPRGRRTG